MGMPPSSAPVRASPKAASMNWSIPTLLGRSCACVRFTVLRKVPSQFLFPGVRSVRFVEIYSWLFLSLEPDVGLPPVKESLAPHVGGCDALAGSGDHQYVFAPDRHCLTDRRQTHFDGKPLQSLSQKSKPITTFGL